MWKGHRSKDKRYSGDNRLIPPKGSAVRRLKWHASWVQNVARQFGLYLQWALEICVDLTLVREDRVGRTSGVPVVAPAAPPGNHVRQG